MKSCEWEEYGRKTGREGENGGNRLAGMSEGSPGAERLKCEGGTAVHMRKPFRHTRYVEMKCFTQDYTVKNAGGTAVIRPAAEVQQDFFIFRRKKWQKSTTSLKLTIQLS